MPFGISGASSSSSSSSSQEVFSADLFRRLFGGASNVAGGIDTSQLTDAANNLFTSGQGFLGDLEGMSAGTDASGQFLEGIVNGEGGFVDENISALQDDLGSFFSEELLPGITSEAVGGGQLGGGRQGVAQGKAIETVGREFRQGSLDIRNEDLRRRTDAAAQLSGQRISASQAGLRGAGQQFDLANAATLTPFSPFLTLSEIMGNPTTLSESESQSESTRLGFSTG
jgi:hypothetical protein